MKRLLSAIIILILLFTFAGAEELTSLEEDSSLTEETSSVEVASATPTDLCPHTNLEQIYYFDNPSYVRLDDETHRVYGVAVVDTVCADCGAILLSETIRDGEEIRPHSYKNGICSLCGARAPESDTPETTAPPAETPVPDPTPIPDIPADTSHEYTLVPSQLDPENPLLTIVVSQGDLDVLQDQCETLLIRPEEGSAAIALPVVRLREELAAENSSLRAEIAQSEDGSVFTSLHFQESEDDLDFTGTEIIRLRFYDLSPEETPKTVIFQPEDLSLPPMEEPITNDPTAAPAPYTTIPWQGNGTYTPKI